ncbi:MAG TPA: NfeD family protein, partial [Solirubrobacteraceae bacterium]|nr:NfeD family protein [Solirubrobacteraceae bacterium]
MAAWTIWIIAACVLAVGEMLTMSFFLAPFAAGALLAAVVSVVGAGDAVTWAVFFVVSLLMLGALRPIARS